MDEGRAAWLRRAAIGVPAILLLGWATTWALAPCRPLDRWLGRSDCVAHTRIDGVGALRQGLAPAPGRGLLVAGWAKSPDGHGEGSPTTLVWLNNDLDEIARQPALPRGIIEQIAVSSDGQAIATTCNLLWTCDAGPTPLPRSADGGASQAPVVLMRFRTESDPDPQTSIARIDWVRTAPTDGADESMDGRTLTLAFTPDGRSLIAGDHGWALDGHELATVPDDIGLPAAGFDAVGSRDGLLEARSEGLTGRILLRRAAGTVPLDPALPEGFIPELRRPLALSPDGSLLAALYRRFDLGTPRTVLRVWRVAEGSPLVATALPDAYPALAWMPGDRIAVALPIGNIWDAETEIRLYAAGRAP